jgi:hypothetical protein
MVPPTIDCLPIPQLFLNFLLRSKIYSKEGLYSACMQALIAIGCGDTGLHTLQGALHAAQ